MIPDCEALNRSSNKHNELLHAALKASGNVCGPQETQILGNGFLEAFNEINETTAQELLAWVKHRLFLFIVNKLFLLENDITSTVAGIFPKFTGEIDAARVCTRALCCLSVCLGLLSVGNLSLLSPVLLFHVNAITPRR